MVVLGGAAVSYEQGTPVPAECQAPARHGGLLLSLKRGCPRYCTCVAMYNTIQTTCKTVVSRCGTCHSAEAATPALKKPLCFKRGFLVMSRGFLVISRGFLVIIIGASGDLKEAPLPSEEMLTEKVLFESQDQNMALTVLYVPSSLDSGSCP